MQTATTDDDLVARYVESKQTTDSEVAVRREIVAELLKRHGRAKAAAMLDMSPQRVSEIVGGVRGK